MISLTHMMHFHKKIIGAPHNSYIQWLMQYGMHYRQQRIIRLFKERRCVVARIIKDRINVFIIYGLT